MVNPKKGSLAHKRFIMKEGRDAFLRGETEEYCIYGYFQINLRSLWLEGFREAERELKNDQVS